MAAVATAQGQKPDATLHLLGHQPRRIRRHVSLRVLPAGVGARPRPCQRPAALDGAPRHGTRQSSRGLPLASNHRKRTIYYYLF